jgi:hypothetical protein
MSASAWVSARREHRVVSFSTSAPFSSHLVALAIHRCTRIPWIADFRDEWAVNPGLRDEPEIGRSMARRLERAITGAAHRVTVAADSLDILDPAPRSPSSPTASTNRPAARSTDGNQATVRWC